MLRIERERKEKDELSLFGALNSLSQGRHRSTWSASFHRDADRLSAFASRKAFRHLSNGRRVNRRHHPVQPVCNPDASSVPTLH